jgi:hypothetical protein
MTTYRGLVARLLLAFIAGACLGVSRVQAAALEEHFPVLKIGANAFTNVTVTSKTKKYVFLIHSKGMMNVKVTDLSPELREQLGYSTEPPKTAQTPANWVKQEIAKLPLAPVAQVEQRWSSQIPAAVDLSRLQSLSRTVIIGASVILFVGYLGFSCCCKLICQKSGTVPGALVWVPFLQSIPLLRAANMSPWWLLAALVPLLNVVVQIVWSVKIVQARGKGLGTMVFLLLPVTNLFAFLYLAFSNSAPPKQERVVEVMTLEAA